MTPTELCNLSLMRVGENRINDFNTDASVPAINCRLQFWPTVFSLLESFDWPFARSRAILSQSTDTPIFEWDYKFVFPSDFLSMRASYLTDESQFPEERYEIEDGFLFTNDSEINLKYTKKMTDTTKFTPMFIDVLKLQLAYNLIPGSAGTEARSLTESIRDELMRKMNKTRTKYLQESNTSGRSDWNYAHYGSRTM